MFDDYEMERLLEEYYLTRKKIFDKWLEEAGVKAIQVNESWENEYTKVGLFKRIEETIHKYEIFTNLPNLLIGPHGMFLDKYKKMLQEFEGNPHTVKIVFVKTKYSYVLEKNNENT